MHNLIHQHTTSFGHAWRGVGHAVVTQPNFVIHLLLSTLALGFGYYLRISTTELLIILVVVMGGLAIELINTAIEFTCDVVDGKIREEIKIAKDAAAGAMLIYAIGAIIVALTIFGPKLI